ncbi:MAG: phosphate ABC transporter substrate-binding protein PstS [Moorea sp. SIOASIH]|uniref:phosphate ABC transporter substrate-binding protein PstS n=1 Tax=Moorena sp. SIOASIH TaxID=2607817 RepID=UPI0013B68588|nr:phosphate ABC transporter substrate-binding protein PstS [Moorena sp. SIOASIH]NEO38244.1 phosphate ABC transporter substrate-binding protein PstS [Moorena sp. SIOASIH]
MSLALIKSRRTLITLTVTVAIVLISLKAASAIPLFGAGASFPQPLYQRYFSQYQQETSVNISYSTIGSGRGIEEFINESFDFAATDMPPTDEEKSQMKRGLQMVPTAGGAVSVIYNLQGVVSSVRLSRDTLGKIFTGQIGNWKQVNTYLPRRDIKVVVRSDSSGTSFIFTNYLSAITHGLIKPSPTPDWGFKVFSSRPQNGGVAAEVRRIDGAIGYIEANYALENNFPSARIENQEGRYIKPSIEQASKGLVNVEFNQDFTLKLNDPADGYPIVGLTWLLLYQKYPNQAKAQGIKDMVNWILTKGQDLNGELGYTRIPDDIARQAIQAVNQNITVGT